MSTALQELEAVFPRSFLLLRAQERKQLGAELAALPAGKRPAAFLRWTGGRKWSFDRAFLPDLGRAELALARAPDAPVESERGFDRVAGASEPEWYAARFRFDPGHCLIESDWNLAEILERPLGGHRPAPAVFLVYRHDGRAALRALDGNEARLLRALSLGVPLGVVLERRCGPDFDSFLFLRWMESGLLRAIHWADA